MDPISAMLSAGTMVGQIVGQQQTNRSNETIASNATAANMQEADRNRQFQAQQASSQMDFQRSEIDRARKWEEQMSNTAFQRSKEDMIKAGINPILFNTPASSPSTSAPQGAAASGSQGSAQTATMVNPFIGLSGAFNSALDAMKTLGDLDIQQEQTKLIRAQTAKTGVDTEVAKKDIPKSETINYFYDAIKSTIKNIFQKDDARNQNAAQKFLKQNPNFGRKKLP